MQVSSPASCVHRKWSKNVFSVSGQNAFMASLSCLQKAEKLFSKGRDIESQQVGTWEVKRDACASGQSTVVPGKTAWHLSNQKRHFQHFVDGPDSKTPNSGQQPRQITCNLSTHRGAYPSMEIRCSCNISLHRATDSRNRHTCTF